MDGGGLIKTRRFADPLYVGDPINAIRILNDKQVDELIVLDRSATPTGSGPRYAILESMSGEAFMPMAYGGGVDSLAHVTRLIRSGFEKVVLNSAAFRNPGLIRQAADSVGSQSVLVAIDVRRSIIGRYEVVIDGGRVKTGLEPKAAADLAVSQGAGELILTGIENEGMRQGYDIGLIQMVSSAVSVPVVAHGGAGCLADCRTALDAGASAAAASSLFVLHGKHRAVLISYPSESDRRDWLH
jgi:cyclase